MENSKYDVAKELLAKVGGDASIQYDSTYSIELAMLEKLGGDTNKKFDSEYSIMKDMLTVINSGGGTVNNQDKTVEVIQNGQTSVTADSGFTGLGTVTINTNVPQPSIQDNKSQDIVANGPIEITPDEAFDAMSKVNINVNVPMGGGSNPGELIIDEASGAFKVNHAINKIVLPDNMDNVTSMNVCFDSCYALTSITLPALPVLTNMGNCFSNCSSLASITLPNLPAVADMGYCFNSCSSLTSITLPELPLVENMERCFAYCRSLTSITLPDLPVLTNMGYCFAGCSALTSITIPELPSATNLSSCCYDAGDDSIKAEVIFKGLPVAANLSTCFCSVGYGRFTNITLPDLPAVTCMDSCFAWSLLSGKLENLTIGAIGNNITTLSNWGIKYCPNITKESLVNIVSALPNPAVGDKICSIGSTNLAKLTPEEIQVATDKGWTLN